MSEKYKFHNPGGIYFVSLTVVDWVDVFTRNNYRSILLDSLNYCCDVKGMEIFAWCIMTNHVHLVFRAKERNPGLLLGDFKKFTSTRLVRAIKENVQESRRKWMLKIFIEAGNRCSNVKDYKFWMHMNHPIELWSPNVISQKIKYVHQNPVVAGFVADQHEYLYSSARDYAGCKGVLQGVRVVSLK